MALNLNLGQVVKTNIASKFKKFVGGIGNQKLNIPNLSDFGKINAKSSGSITSLAFPLDVTSAPGNGNHGHYVMFFVNEQTNAKLKFGNADSTSDKPAGYNERGEFGITSIEPPYRTAGGDSLLKIFFNTFFINIVVFNKSSASGIWPVPIDQIGS